MQAPDMTTEARLRRPGFFVAWTPVINHVVISWLAAQPASPAKAGRKIREIASKRERVFSRPLLNQYHTHEKLPGSIDSDLR
jgi:hypothetical protein